LGETAKAWIVKPVPAKTGMKLVAWTLHSGYGRNLALIPGSVGASASAKHALTAWVLRPFDELDAVG
jgi:hypothetical protein